jgi:DMSO/TMAO reductase YedYZ molybdopterin-dependent catalytic subunit
MAIHGSYKWLSKSPGEGGRRLPSRRLLLSAVLARVLRAQKPEISSFDFSLLEDAPVHPELFFVREHFPMPAVSSAGWKLTIGGAVTAPVELPYADLITQPRKNLPVTIECADNPAGGGLVSHAEWNGIPLAGLLEKARPSPQARFVRLTAADGFSRAVPLEKAMHADTLLATGMNGERLNEKHGFPLRAILPGWYGMDSVKWLRAIELLEDEPPQGYQRQVRALLGGARRAGPVTAMNVKSAFSRPLDGAIVQHRRFTVRGAAWAGENRVRLVEVSADGGKSWAPARLDSEPRPYAWVCWSFEWNIPAPGPQTLTVRATDDQGRRQPETRPSDRADRFESNAWQTVRVTVSS